MTAAEDTPSSARLRADVSPNIVNRISFLWTLPDHRGQFAVDGKLRQDSNPFANLVRLLSPSEKARTIANFSLLPLMLPKANL